MTTRGLEEFIKYLKDRTYDLKVRYGRGNTVSISIFFINDGAESKVVNNEDRSVLSKIAELILMQKPKQVRAEITSNYKKEIHTYIMTNDISNDNSSLSMNYSQNQNFGGFGGFDQKNIESIVNKRLEEERKERELIELRSKLELSKETIASKSKQIEGLKSEIETKAEEIEDLQNTIESKKNFKYYAGITGDILQSFGIKKELIATPLAGILAGNSADNPKAITENSNDSSGIVDDEQPQISSANSKREEMIALIGEYLKGVDNRTLSNVFTIFSEIESNPNNSNLILEFLNTKN